MTDASAGVTTTVLVPANAVATETELIFVPVTTAPETPPDTFSFAGYAFSIDAYQNDEYVPYLTLDQPVILTIEYDDNAIGEFDESMLTLTYWDGVQWTEQGITIVDRDQENNQLVVSIMHLTDFAMFGKTYIKVYLPLVIDNP